MTGVSRRSDERTGPAGPAASTRRARPSEPDYAAVAGDADRLAALPPHNLLRVLHLLAQLPAITTWDLRALVYPDRRHDEDLDLVAMLEQRSLVRSYFERKHIRDATYAVLTKARVRLLAMGVGVTPEELVARYALDDVSLSDRVGRAPETLARYGMLTQIAGMPSHLAGWRRHWPPDAPNDSTPEPLRSALPALATFSRSPRAFQCLLLADPTDEDEPLAHNVRPVDFYRPILEAVIGEHVRRREPVPPLYVSITGDVALRQHPRRDRWQALLEDVRGAFPEAPTFCFAIGDRFRLGSLYGPVRLYPEPGLLY